MSKHFAMVRGGKCFFSGVQTSAESGPDQFGGEERRKGRHKTKYQQLERKTAI